MKAAVIGTGVISEQHLRVLRGEEDVTVVGVCDLSAIAARTAADRFGAGAPYTDYRAMLSEAKPDVVHILTPPKTHVPLAKDCLDAGAHVICEKPIALSHSEFTDLWQHAERAGRRLIENHNYRFNAGVQRISDLARADALGKVSDVEVRMVLGIRGGGRYADRNLPHPSHQLPCGVLHEFVTHLTYLLLHFMPECADHSWDVFAAKLSNHGAAEGDPFRYDDLDATVVRDGAHGRIRFSSHAAPDQFSVTVVGDKARVACDLFNPQVMFAGPRPGPEQLAGVFNQLAGGVGLIGAGLLNFISKLLQRTPYEGLDTMLQQTYAALRSDGDLPVTFEQMDAASRFVDRIVQENQGT